MLEMLFGFLKEGEQQPSQTGEKMRKNFQTDFQQAAVDILETEGHQK